MIYFKALVDLLWFTNAEIDRSLPDPESYPYKRFLKPVSPYDRPNMERPPAQEAYVKEHVSFGDRNMWVWRKVKD